MRDSLQRTADEPTVWRAAIDVAPAMHKQLQSGRLWWYGRALSGMSIPRAMSAPPSAEAHPGVGAIARGLRRYLVPLVAFVVVLAAALLACTLGPAEQGYFDSAFYVDGARHLARGDGYVSAFVEQAGRSTFQPITHWAPGVSLMMTPLIWLGASPLTAAAIVVGACYVAAALLLFLLGTSLAGARAWPLALLVGGLYAFQPGTRVWLDAVLSDLPWATFALLSLWLGLWVMRSPAPSVPLRFFWGLSLWWVVLVRYAGLLFLPGLVGAVLLGMRAQCPLWKRPVLLWPALLPAALGIGLWNLRNKHVADRPLGGWQFARSEIAEHLSRATRAATLWTSEAQEIAAKLGLSGPLFWLLTAALISLVPLVVVSVRSHWRELVLIMASALGYFSALVFTASVTVIAKLSESRFWVVIWPLTWLAILLVVCAARPRWCLPFKVIVVGWLSVVLGLYAYQTYLDAPHARRQRGTLDPAWARVATVVPGPETCKVFMNDPRPLMLHLALPPTSTIPLTLAELEDAVKRSPGNWCVVTTEPSKRLRLSSSAERRRRNQNEVLDALKAQKRLKPITRKPGVAVYQLR